MAPDTVKEPSSLSNYTGDVYDVIYPPDSAIPFVEGLNWAGLGYSYEIADGANFQERGFTIRIFGSIPDDLQARLSEMADVDCRLITHAENVPTRDLSSLS